MCKSGHALTTQGGQSPKPWDCPHKLLSGNLSFVLNHQWWEGLRPPPQCPTLGLSRSCPLEQQNNPCPVQNFLVSLALSTHWLDTLS